MRGLWLNEVNLSVVGTKKSPVDPLPTFDDIDFDLPSKIDQQALDEAGLEMEISQDLNCPSSQGLVSLPCFLSYAY